MGNQNSTDGASQTPTEEQDNEDSTYSFTVTPSLLEHLQQESDSFENFQSGTVADLQQAILDENESSNLRDLLEKQKELETTLSTSLLATEDDAAQSLVLEVDRIQKDSSCLQASTFQDEATLTLRDECLECLRNNANPLKCQQQIQHYWKKSVLEKA